MKTYRIIYAGLAGGLAFFLLGWLVYGILLNDFMMNNYNNCSSRPSNEMVWWAIILSNLVSAYLIAIVISWANAKNIVDGIKIAAILGLLITASMDLSLYSMSTTFLNTKALIIDVAVATLLWSVVGFVISFVIFSGKKKA
jgi:hypothetical protein